MTSRTVLVTGGAGFIGSTFVRHLREKHPSYRILVLDAMTYAGSFHNLPDAVNRPTDRFEFWYGSVSNADLVTSLVQRSDYIVHFAAETHVTRSIYDNQLFFETDVLGTQTICHAVLKTGKQVKRLIHVSTSEVYGTAQAKLMDEEHPLNPMSPYASAKCGADRLVYSYWATYQIPAVIVRPFNNYGPRQHLEKVVPRFITGVLLEQPITVHGDGSAARDFVHAEDTCAALDLVMHADDEKVVGEVFNVASEQDRSIVSIAHDIVERMNGRTESITFLGDRPGQVVRHSGDAKKIKQRLGWQPRFSWNLGLQHTIDWFAGNRSAWEQQMWMRTIPIITASGKVEQH
jgi:dTDP-glucose 4,6-dehydratase